MRLKPDPVSTQETQAKVCGHQETGQQATRRTLVERLFADAATVQDSLFVSAEPPIRPRAR